MTVSKSEIEIKKDKKVADMATYQLNVLFSLPMGGIRSAEIKGIIMTRTGRFATIFICCPGARNRVLGFFPLLPFPVSYLPLWFRMPCRFLCLGQGRRR